MCYPYFLTGRIHADTALEVQPVSTGTNAANSPIFVLIEFADFHEQLIGGSVDIATEFGYLVAEFLAIPVFAVKWMIDSLYSVLHKILRHLYEYCTFVQYTCNYMNLQ